MSARVRVRRHGDRLVAVKVAVAAGDDLSLVREAAMLTVARHPGVAPLVGLARDEDHLELLTTWIGTRSLLDARSLTPGQAVAVAGSLAATVADLHRRGVVHGAIEPSHVLLDSLGRPVLCSFGRAQLVGPPGAGPARPSDDVCALGELLADLVGRPDDPELVPSRRFGRRHEQHLHGDVLTLADHARAHDATIRPSAAALASALADLAPEATAVRPRRRRWSTVGITVLAGAAGVAAIGTSVIGASAGPDATRSTTTIATRAAAPTVELAGRRYEVGRAGDRAHVAHWRCDGDRQVILVRPTTGEVFLFDDVPAAGEERAVPAFVEIPGATDARAVGADDPCPSLVVEQDDGQAVPLALPAEP